jgi:hypothetical protein
VVRNLKNGLIGLHSLSITAAAAAFKCMLQILTAVRHPNILHCNSRDA